MTPITGLDLGKPFLAQHLLPILGRGFHLPQDHAVISAARLHELFVASTLDHAALFQQEDQIGPAHRRETMGDDEDGSTRQQRGHRSLNELLAFRVQVAGGLVENEDLRRFEDRADFFTTG